MVAGCSAVRRPHRRNAAVLGCQIRDRAAHEHRLGGERHTCSLGLHCDLHAVRRAAAQREEVIMHANAFQLEDLAPDLSQKLLGGRAWGDELVRPGWRGRQPPSTNARRSTFPPGVRGSASVTQKSAGTIAAGSWSRRNRRSSAVSARLRQRPRMGDQPGVPAAVLSGHHRALANPWVLRPVPPRPRPARSARRGPSPGHRGVPDIRYCRRAGTAPSHRCGTSAGRDRSANGSVTKLAAIASGRLR